MEITLLGVEDCPNLALARRRLTAAVGRAGVTATVDERIVTAGDIATGLEFRGSPTILVDGHDPFPAAAPGGLACRLYPTPAGPQGAPTVDDLVEVLA